MRRVGIAILLLIAATPAAAQITGSLPPVTPSLKRDVTVASDLVRIGDLFDNAGANARVPIFRAPDLGQTGSVSAARVVEAARAHGVAIVDTGGIAEVSVTRASRVITVKDIEARIANALAGQPGLGEAKNLSMTFDREPRPIQLEPSVTGDLQTARLAYDPASSRFDISFELPDGRTGRRLSLRYMGTAFETVEAAVLTRALNRGDLVKAADVVTERRAKAEFRNDAASPAGAAVGRAARRALRAGDALHAGDLTKPDIVQRNETVTLIYATPGLMLTMRGKAVDSGAEGDTVSVLNIQSKRTVQGTVIGPGEVTVAAVTPRIVSEADATSQSQPPGGEPR